jgi:hypothetical protein
MEFKTMMIGVSQTLDEIYEDINNFKNAELLIELIIGIPYHNKIRAQIHQYVKELNLFSRSYEIKGGKGIKISKYEIKEVLDAITISTFVDYSRIPIPLTNPELFEYYLNILDPYYEANDFFKLYMEEIKKYKNVGTFRNYINKIMDIMINDLNNTEELKKFKMMELDVPSLKFGGNVYKNTNSEKHFISIDIKTANFTILRTLFPTLFGGEKTWIKFLSKYTDSKFLLKSKYLREVLFGKLNCVKRINTVCPILMNRVVGLVDEINENNDLTVECIESDEVVYQINCSLDVFKEKKYYEKIFALNKDDDLFHVRTFKLIKLSDKGYFIKDYVMDSSDKKKEFKCCPKKFIIQCIKFAEKKPIELNDLKFMDEGMIATYERSVFE